jgi:hypothetical protein
MNRDAKVIQPQVPVYSQYRKYLTINRGDYGFQVMQIDYHMIFTQSIPSGARVQHPQSVLSGWCFWHTTRAPLRG